MKLGLHGNSRNAKFESKFEGEDGVKREKWTSDSESATSKYSRHVLGCEKIAVVELGLVKAWPDALVEMML